MRRCRTLCDVWPSALLCAERDLEAQRLADPREGREDQAGRANRADPIRVAGEQHGCVDRRAWLLGGRRLTFPSWISLIMSWKNASEAPAGLMAVATFTVSSPEVFSLLPLASSGWRRARL